MSSERAFQVAPEAASNFASRVDALALFLTIVSAVFIVLIIYFIVYFAIRYRRRSEDEIPPKTGEHLWLEVAWTVLPLFLLMTMFVWGASLFIYIKKPPAHALEINVMGKRWMWKIQHPDGQREINELHVPTGRAVKLIMTSQDVIHDFSVPAFRIKQDVLPGSYITQWFEATKPGTYHLFCAEYCGTSHSQMIGSVVVMNPQDYEGWLAGRIPEHSPEAAGARLFTTYGCAQCHGQTAPTLAGIYGREVRLSDGSVVIADEQYLRESILNPPAKIVAEFRTLMPSYRGQLTEEQLADLVAYIKSLRAAATTQPNESFDLNRIPNMPPARGAAR